MKLHGAGSFVGSHGYFGGYLNWNKMRDFGEIALQCVIPCKLLCFIFHQQTVQYRPYPSC